MFCTECGRQIRDDAKFCGECGLAQSAGNSGEKFTSTPVTTDLNNDNQKVTLASKIGFFGLTIFLILLFLVSANNSEEVVPLAGLDKQALIAAAIARAKAQKEATANYNAIRCLQSNKEGTECLGNYYLDSH